MSWIAIGVGLNFALAAEPGLAASVGMGGVSRASLSELGTVLTAPAVLALAPRYELAVGGRLGTDKVRRYEAAAMDSTTGPLTLGVAFIREVSERPATIDELPGWLEPGATTTNARAETTLGGGLAFSWLNRHLAAGVGVRYVRDAPLYGGDSQRLQWDLSVGGRIGEQVILSASGQDLVPKSWDAFAPQLGAGARWQLERRAGLEVDVNAGWEDEFGGAPALRDVRAGGEILANGTVPLRAGYRRDLAADADYVTAGLGVATEQAELGYGAELRLGERSHQHAVTLHAFF